MLFDTHAHVNFRAYKDDAKETMQRALDAGVSVINIGSQIDTSRQALEVAKQFESGVYAVVGLHPEHTYAHKFTDEDEAGFYTREEGPDVSTYRELALDSKVVGIGECGLDYYRLPEGEDHEAIKHKQKAAFISQIKLAQELDKTLVIHTRSSKGTDDACLDVLEILEQLRSPAGGANYELRFVLHSFTGSPEVLQKFLDIGSYVSFNGIITFDKTGNMEQLVKRAPLERIVLETDCPYLTPVPHRGKRNEPAYVAYVAQKVADLKGLGVEEVSAETTANAQRLFHL